MPNYNTLVGDLGTGRSAAATPPCARTLSPAYRPVNGRGDAVTSTWSKKREVTAAPRELQMIRINIAHHPETIAVPGRVLRLERGRVLGSEAADPSLLGAAA